MKLLNWIKEKYQHRRAGRDDHDPWWVTLMLDVGRPLVAILILIMCAPGEHYLAVQAGWSETLAWGMPGALTAYAGIAAVVATKRPKGAPGRRTAIWGAVLSIGLAMAAQPIAHLYGRGGLDREAVALTIAVSCIPAAVFGHLLHMGAASPKPPTAVDVHRPPDMPAGQPGWISDNQAAADTAGQSMSDLLSAPDSPPDAARWTRPMDMPVPVDNAVFGQLSPDSPVRDKIAKACDLPVDLISPPVSTLSEPSEIVYTDYRTEKPKTVRSIKSGSVAADVRRFLSDHPEIVSAYRAGQPGGADADLSGHIRARWPDASWDTIRKARDRYLDKTKETS